LTTSYNEISRQVYRLAAYTFTNNIYAVFSLTARQDLQGPQISLPCGSIWSLVSGAAWCERRYRASADIPNYISGRRVYPPNR
jgi:hypothetical protein